MLTYNLEFFNNYNEQSICLSEPILIAIKKLHNELHIDNIVEPKKIKRQKRSMENLKNLDFKCTVIKKKEGDEKIINDIRSSLNKLSDKNYDTQLELLIENINLLIEDKDDKNITNIMELLLDISSGNSYLSNLYAKLWKYLIEKYGNNNYIDMLFDKYTNLINNIEYMDPNIDYDKHCKINKVNDKRKNITTFMVNLLQENVITKEYCINVINNVIDDIENNIIDNIPEYKNDELVEILKVLVTNSVSILKTHNSWKNIHDYIVDISNKKKKDLNSISTRTLFKFMDMRDKLI